MCALDPKATLSSCKLVPAARIYLSWGDKETRAKGKTPIGERACPLIATTVGVCVPGLRLLFCPQLEAVSISLASGSVCVCVCVRVRVWTITAR